MFSLRWLGSKDEYDNALLNDWDEIRTVDQWIGESETFAGYCSVCCAPSNFRVFGGAWFGPGPNLREGMVCPTCGLSNRQRLVLCVARNIWQVDDVSLLLQERLSNLYSALTSRYRYLQACEYLEHLVPLGETAELHGVKIRNEDATSLTFADASFDGVLHNDVLEHIPDYRASLREAHRVLKPDGILLFTCPFFARRTENLVRAKVNDVGDVEHLEPQEWHGNPLSEKGILAYHHFGWQLLDDLKRTGFHEVEIGVAYDPLFGITSNRFPDDYGLMMPVVFRARKGWKPLGRLRWVLSLLK